MKDYFGKTVDYGDFLVTLFDYKSKAYLKDKSLIYQVVGDGMVACIDKPKNSLSGGGTLYDLICGDMGVKINYKKDKKR